MKRIALALMLCALPGMAIANAPPPEPLYPPTLTPIDILPGDPPQVVTLIEVPVCYAEGSAKVNDPEDPQGAKTSALIGELYGKCVAFMQANELGFGGAPLAITLSYDPAGDWVFRAAIPVIGLTDATPRSGDGGVAIGMSPAGQAVKVVHQGSYHSMATAYETIAAYMKANNLAEGPHAIEEYVSDPGNTPEAELITNVYFLIGPGVHKE